MIIEIIRDGEIIAEKQVQLRGLNYQPSDQEWFDLALDDAIDDGDIDETERRSVTCRFKS